MSQSQFESWKLAAVSPSPLPLSKYAAPSATTAVADASNPPQAEWAAEAIVNVRHVVAGIGFALVIEAAAAIAIVATWNLWHIRYWVSFPRRRGWPDGKYRRSAPRRTLDLSASLPSRPRAIHPIGYHACGPYLCFYKHLVQSAHVSRSPSLQGS